MVKFSKEYSTGNTNGNPPRKKRPTGILFITIINIYSSCNQKPLRARARRSWDKVFVCVQGGANLAFYKDAKAARSSPDAYFKGETPVDLRGGSAEVAADYTKKKFVLRVKLATGAEFLFQARGDAEMRQWVNALTAVCEQDAAGTQSRSQTLPAVGDRRDEPKRRSFFTLKKV